MILAACSPKTTPSFRDHKPRVVIVENERKGDGQKEKVVEEKHRETEGHRKKKHEFRGAWIQTAWQERFQTMSTKECQDYLTRLVDMLKETGFNAVIFQVRPEGDAFYKSEYEPWSRFLTGIQGKAPAQPWDPMEFMIKLCHDRDMEFHAWLNPYRMWMSQSVKAMDEQHLYYKHPEWFVSYDNRLYLNPALPQSRSFIRTVVSDIVTRYDVDAIHMDDYFYPYPVAGQTYNDRKEFNAYAPQMNLDMKSKDALGNFRRRNVDILIKYLHEDIKKIKPTVRFGISPFGIYRNKSSWQGGSETRGTQCYDDLYADIMFWAESGWIDYVIPQIYWEIGNNLADYTTVLDWWNDNIPKNCDLYIGQSIERSLDGAATSSQTPPLTKSHKQFDQKLKEAAKAKNVRGNCFWFSYQIEDNYFNVRDYLYNHWNK